MNIINASEMSTNLHKNHNTADQIKAKVTRQDFSPRRSRISKLFHFQIRQFYDSHAFVFLIFVIEEEKNRMELVFFSSRNTSSTSIDQIFSSNKKFSSFQFYCTIKIYSEEIYESGAKNKTTRLLWHNFSNMKNKFDTKSTRIFIRIFEK